MENIQEENNGKIPSSEPLIHSFNKETIRSAISSPKIIALFIGVVVVGILTGYFLSGNVSTTGSSSNVGEILNLSSVPKGTIIGSDDTKTFNDIAEGVLKEGGVEGEGAYHLERPGGESQNVYLTSSIVDLSKVKDRKIKVWGQTQKAQHAGWLMDVGKVEVL
ncbi:MAG: hypothetical protein COU25_01360 [Candidatus Levybacteria bacterium CG10_big_fil_rev_8_21_14_0_10_35_13]|nr:MAG: hypothetical protein COU25_01360 [Candidatus Levybacteria bacterium CG10_big_fil_rev_8_21_14_0_10_35_13]